MIEGWTVNVVGRMHLANITGKQLADECGYSAAYLSTVLHGKAGTESTKNCILEALERLEEQAQEELARQIQAEREKLAQAEAEVQAQTETEVEADVATDGESVCDQ